MDCSQFYWVNLIKVLLLLLLSHFSHVQLCAIPGGKIPHATEQLSPCTTTAELVFQSQGAATAEVPVPQCLRAPVPLKRSHCITPREQPLLAATREKSRQQYRPSIAKKMNNKTNFFLRPKLSKGFQGKLFREEVLGYVISSWKFF